MTRSESADPFLHSVRWRIDDEPQDEWSATRMTHHYDPELAAAAAAAPVFDVERPGAARALLAELGAASPPFRFPHGVTARTEVVAAGGRTVEVGIIRSAAVGGAPSPALLWFHGGGFVFGTGAMDHPLHARLVEELGVVIVSVEYGLAPEHPYPAAVEEGCAALEWTASHASELGIDPLRIAVGGHSAGGCLAAAVALMARDRGGPAPCFQVLDLPVTDDRLDTPSMLAYTDTPIWDRANAAASWRAYLSGAVDDDRPYAAPLQVADLSGLPPAYVAVAELDPLRDEGIAYAQRLVQAGVSTELHLFPGTFHGSAAAVPEAAVTRTMVGGLIRALDRAFTRPSAVPSGPALATAAA